MEKKRRNSNMGSPFHSTISLSSRHIIIIRRRSGLLERP